MLENTVDLNPNGSPATSLGGTPPGGTPRGGIAAGATVSSGATLAVGRVLRERYVIQEKLGSGGRGTVFKALDRYRASLPDSQQHVALKVLHAGTECPEQTIKDLRRELHCGQALSHRNIVNVYELDRDADVVFFTMELLEGELLADVLARLRPTGLQPAQAWQLIRQLGAGLAHAHERGIVHGDLKPRNILITHAGELRILDFGAAHKMVLADADPTQTRLAPQSGTPAYASCEILEGRTADACDDLYALACICHELLSGEHPFASRPATLARDYGVKAVRPAGLSGRQWRTLQSGLSWHRAGRSMSVHAWIHRLTPDSADQAPITPLREFKPAAAAKSPWRFRAAAACTAVLLITGACIVQLRATSVRKEDPATAAPQSALPSEPLEAADTLPPPPVPTGGASLGTSKDSTVGLLPSKPPVRKASSITVDGYHVSSGDHFVEIRVRRNQIAKNASFTWWTEPATARQNVDYVHQAKAIQTFATERRTTRFYVKLLPESGRSQRDYFYVAIAQPGRDKNAAKVTRVQIWLPTSRDQLQASR